MKRESHHTHPFIDSNTTGFDDQGRLIAVTWDGHQTLESSILDALEDAGAVFPDRERAEDVLSLAIEARGDVRAAQALSMIFARLPGGRRGEELRAAFLGMIEGESLAETAARHGVTKVTWFKAIQRLRNRLLPRMANDSTIGRGAECRPE